MKLLAPAGALRSARLTKIFRSCFRGDTVKFSYALSNIKLAQRQSFRQSHKHSGPRAELLPLARESFMIWSVQSVQEHLNGQHFTERPDEQLTISYPAQRCSSQNCMPDD